VLHVHVGLEMDECKKAEFYEFITKCRKVSIIPSALIT